MMVVYYVLIVSLFGLGITMSVIETKHLQSAVNGKFAKSVKATEDDNAC